MEPFNMSTEIVKYPLEIEDVQKSYGSHEVLKGISVSARRGDVISIIGSSGSGKSTFLRCINFLEIPDRGRFFINGEQVSMKPGPHGADIPSNRRQIERLRTNLGMVFQNFNLWAHMTVLEKVIEAPVQVRLSARSSSAAWSPLDLLCMNVARQCLLLAWQACRLTFSCSQRP